MAILQRTAGAHPGIVHVPGCRLTTEVLPRLMALQGARQLELDATFELACLRKLAGWAAVHLGAVREYGCGCSEGRAA